MPLLCSAILELANSEPALVVDWTQGTCVLYCGHPCDGFFALTLTSR